MSNMNVIKARQELQYAKGMVERRQALVAGLDGMSGRELLESYRSLLGCLRETRKHHNKVMELLDDESAGVALETSALVDWSLKWVSQVESMMREFEVSDDRIVQVRREVGV